MVNRLFNTSERTVFLMLGTSAQNLNYKSIHDYSSPADYLSYMFGGMEGVIYRATIDPYYHQSFYRASGIVKASYFDVNNCYVSMNTFFRTKDLDTQTGRDVAHLKRLNALYVDIDCYAVGLSKNEVLMRLEDEFFETVIPVPTFVIDSGRGIYLIWKLRNEDRKALPRWTSVEEYLVDSLKALGADSASKDAARILRVPFTKNSKSGSFVKIEEFNDVTYSLYEIEKEYGIHHTKKTFSANPKKTEKTVYPYGHATERQRKFVRDIARKLSLSEDVYPDFTSFEETDRWIKLHKELIVTRNQKDFCYKKGNMYSLSEFKSMKSILRTYCEEIKLLFAMRKGENCKRELGLFLYRYFLREMKHDSDYALKEMLAFNASLDCPFDEKYVIRATASADKRIDLGIPYAYRKSTIIKVLAITEEELSHLPFLASNSDSKKARKKEQNRCAYDARLASEGKQRKKDALLERRAALYQLKAEGKTPTEIQNILNISRATYHRDTAALSCADILYEIKEFIKEQAERLSQTSTKAKTVAKNILAKLRRNKRKTVKKPLASLWRACKNAVSHFFSTPFIEKHSFAVPYSRCKSQGVSHILKWIVKKRGTSPSEDTDDSS